MGAPEMLESGVNQIEIASRPNVAQSGICHLRTRFHQTGSSSGRQINS